MAATERSLVDPAVSDTYRRVGVSINTSKPWNRSRWPFARGDEHAPTESRLGNDLALGLEDREEALVGTPAPLDDRHESLGRVVVARCKVGGCRAWRN